MKTQKNPQRCPAHIINATPAIRIEHFKSYLSNHHHLDRARTETMNAINRSTGPRVILVTGPSGVGKTTLAKKIAHSIMAEYEEEAREDRGFIPVVSLNAVPPNGTNFSWKDMYIRCLTGQGDVMTDRKLLLPRQGQIFDDTPIYSPIERSASDGLLLVSRQHDATPWGASLRQYR